MTTKEGQMTTLETELNKMAWHLKVAEESERLPCPMVIGQCLRRAKEAFDYIDNH